MPRTKKLRPEKDSVTTATDSKMFDWSTQERVSQVPAWIWPGISTAKGRDHLFVGRKAELEKLEQRHGRLPERVDRNLPADEQSFITVVTNAPGVGKSALVEELQEQHVQSGGYYLGLHSSDLRNSEALRAALQESDPAQQAELLRQAKLVKRLTGALRVASATDTGAVADIAEIVFQQVVKAATKLGELQPERKGTVAHARMVELLATHGKSLNAMSMLRLMGQGAEGRLLIIVDEAQELGEKSDEQTGKLLQQLGDPSERTRLKLQSGGVILAGLPDAIQRLRELHKSRAYTLHLAPLQSEDVHTMLRRACTRGDRRGALTEAEVDHIVAELGNDFGEWTHHAHAAGFAAEWILHNATRQEPTVGGLDVDRLLDWMRTNAALGTCQLYDQIAEGARGILGTAGVLEAVQAMAKHGEVPQSLLVARMEAYRKEHGAEPIADMNNAAGLQALLHYGLIGRRRNTGGGTTDVLEVPIPSLTKYLMVTRGEAMRQNIEEPQAPAIGTSGKRKPRRPRTD